MVQCLPQPQWASPPRQLEVAPPGAAALVIGDHPIAFNFRDAKQYWGLEDCMHVTPTGGTKAANRSFFMGKVASHLRTAVHPRDPDYSGLDLQADYRGYKYGEETIQFLPENPAPVFLEQICNKVAGVGRIHVAQPSFSLS